MKLKLYITEVVRTNDRYKEKLIYSPKICFELEVIKKLSKSIYHVNFKRLTYKIKHVIFKKNYYRKITTIGIPALHFPNFKITITCER